MHARNIIVDSMCPQVYGLFYVKLSVLSMLIIGLSCNDSSGMHVRGESHMLLVGNADTAKLQLLKYATKLIPRSVLTTGMGSTSASLVALVIKTGPEWQLEAGALVLADNGLCCIDEFGSLSRNEQNAVFKAMEQQSLSINKGGFACNLNAYCSELAAMSARDKYDIESSLSTNTALPTSPLNRFDLVLVLLDTHDEQWDAQV
ncbi:MCM2/3/5 family-domain-containing protein [Coemansia mojavensis]|nr:MCM2/3/5 family-domain-containing protein [Coemansia mojavensis]